MVIIMVIIMNNNVTTIIVMIIIEGSLETKVSTIWTDETAQPGRNSDVEKVRRETVRDAKSQKREDAGARKGKKVAKHSVFPMSCGSAGSKSRRAKAAGAEPAPQMKDEKLHAVVGRSTFASQNVQSTSVSEHL